MSVCDQSVFVTANEARHQSRGDNRSRAQEHVLMRACWRGPSQPSICVLCCVHDVPQPFLSDTLGERKCEWSRPGGVKFPLRAPSFAPGDFGAEVCCGADRAVLWAGLEDGRGPAASQSPPPGVLCIIIHSGPRPQTPPSHHLSCCCHSDFYRDLSLSRLPEKSTAQRWGRGILFSYCGHKRI